MASYWPYLGGDIRAPRRRRRRSSTSSSGARRRAAWALGAMAVVLVLGSGGDDILWAFQSGHDRGDRGGDGGGRGRAATAGGRRDPADGRAGDLGRRARVLGRDRPPPAADPTAGAAVAARCRSCSTWAGSCCSALGDRRPPRFDGLPEYVLTGLTASAAGAIGSTSLVVGQLVLLALAFGLGWVRDVPPVVLSLLASGVAFFIVAGLARAQLGPEQATALALRLRRRAGDHHRRAPSCWPGSAGRSGRHRGRRCWPSRWSATSLLLVETPRPVRCRRSQCETGADADRSAGAPATPADPRAAGTRLDDTSRRRVLSACVPEPIPRRDTLA